MTREEKLDLIFNKNAKEVDRIITGTIARMLYPQTDIEDYIQDAKVVIVSKIDKLDNPNCWRSWIYPIARNTTINTLKAEDRRPMKGALEIIETDVITDEDVLIGEREQVMRAVGLAGWNNRKKEVVRLFFDGYGKKEIYKKTGQHHQPVVNILNELVELTGDGVEP